MNHVDEPQSALFGVLVARPGAAPTASIASAEASASASGFRLVTAALVGAALIVWAAA